jgi:hypothetical protein
MGASIKHKPFRTALALVVDALAPTFGGTKNPLNAFKLLAYAGTAGFVGGIFSLMPALSLLGLLASLLSIYLGLPELMKCLPEKAVPYTAVVLVCGFVAMLILGAVSGVFRPRPGLHLGTGFPALDVLA